MSLQEGLFLYLRCFLKKNKDRVLYRWLEPHRFYHDINHLNYVVNGIKALKDSIDQYEFEKLIIIAIYHDCVYNPKVNAKTSSTTNELESAKVYKEDFGDDYDEEIYNAILDTHYDGRGPSSKISEIFMKIDLKGFQESFEILKKNEDLLFKEFQYVPYPLYKEGKLKVLENFKDQFLNETSYNSLVNYVTYREPKIGFYAGSFAPFHKGHLDVLKQSEQVFDKVILACGKNASKNVESEIPSFLEYHQILNYSGLLTDCIKSLGHEVTLIRGIRNSEDMQYEYNLAQYLKELMPNIKITYFISNPNYLHYSSSWIRTMKDTEIYNSFIPTIKDYLC